MPLNLEVKNRVQMADRLEAVMNSTYGELREELRLKRKHTMLKTYLLESHTSEGASADDTFRTLSNAFERSRRKGVRSVEVNRTDEKDFFTVRGSTRSEDFLFFVDAADSRFWVAHSISKSQISDLEVDALTDGSSNLDSAWMPIELLSKLLALGQSRGLALDFDRRYLDAPLKKRKVRGLSLLQTSSEAHAVSQAQLEVAPISRSKHLEYVKMQLWGEGADRVLSALEKADLGQSTTLAKIRLRSEDADDDSLFSLADVKFDGKVTGRGSSFGLYSLLVGDVKRKYSEAVRNAEVRFDIHWTNDRTGPRLSGEPLYISLGDGLENLDRFCAKVFSGTEPFRLLGFPIRRNEDFYTVSAIDMHVNQRVDFEITRRTISAFLPHKTCGNTLLRLYTNLQHFYSSDVKAIDGTGAGVFSFQS